MSDFLARHGAHVVSLGGPVVLLAGLFAALELTRPERRRRRPAIGSARWLALAWTAVATTHLAVIPEHFDESVLLGVFFLVLSAAQYSYAVAVLLRPSRRLLLFGMAANVSVVLLWTYTRTVAIPFGLGAREAVGIADVVATALEVVTVVLAGLMVHSARSSLGQRAGVSG